MPKQILSEDEIEAHRAEVNAYCSDAIRLYEEDPDGFKNIVKIKADGSVKVTPHPILSGKYEKYKEKFVKEPYNA